MNSKNPFDNKKVIIFDLDGTLIDTIGTWNEVDKTLINRLSEIPVDIENIHQMRDTALAKAKSNNIYLDYCNSLKEKFNLKMSPSEILNLRWKISDEYLKNIVEYKLNADKVLIKLKELGYRLALATTTGNRQIDAYVNYNKNIRKKAKLDEIFEIILTKENVENKKPNPEVHYKVMEHFKVEPSECLIIEDSLIGVKAAKNSGVEVATIYDKYSDPNREEINKLTDYNFNTFDEILEILN